MSWWDWLTSNFSSSASHGNIVSSGDEEQTEISRSTGNIWSAVRTADLNLLKKLLVDKPELVNQRGPVGETILHMCFLYNTSDHRRIADYLIHDFPLCITDVYNKIEYQGENVLHIAIINQDFASVKMLVQKSTELLKARATGTFFQQGSACYYGEYPLSFAACTNQKHMVCFLLDSGADFEAVDTHGNTVLHLLVIHNLPEMYAYVKKEFVRREQVENVKKDKCKAEDLWKQRNHDGLTPFTLAAKIGSKSMFSFLLDEQRQVQWTYGPVSCYLYPLFELDLHIPDSDLPEPPSPRPPLKSSRASSSSSSSRPSTSPNLSSSSSSSPSTSSNSSHHNVGALELIMNEAHVDLLMHPRMIDLVKQKWERFAQRIFFQRFVTVLIYLLIFTSTVILRQSVEHIADYEINQLNQSGSESSLASDSSTNSSASESDSSSDFTPDLESWLYWHYQYPIFVRLGELFVIAGAVHKAQREYHEMQEAGLVAYFSSSGAALLENILSVTYCICIGFVVLCHLIGSPVERAFLAGACISGWSYIFFFLLAFRLTGPMVVMIYQMLLNDVLRFCTIYLVFLMGFAQAFFVLFESVGLSGFVLSIKTCFVAMLGDFDLEQFADTPYTAVSVSLLVIYVVTITILLLNLLIAMMGDTYEKINEAAEMRWHLERARIVFAIENEMSAEERNSEVNKYWTIVDNHRYLQVMDTNPYHFKKNQEPKED